MKLLFLNPSGQLGGAEAALCELLAGLRASHPSWSLSLLAAAEGPLVDRVRNFGVPVRVLPFPPSLARLGDWGAGHGIVGQARFVVRCLGALVPTLGYVRRLRRAINEQRPDIVHTNGLKMHVLGAWTLPHGAVLLWHLHDYVGRRPMTARLLRRYARACSAVIANSRSVAADVRQVLGDTAAVYPVWNAVDLTRFSRSGPTLDLDRLAGLPSPHGPITRVGLVATFARWKGHRTFLEALARMPSSAGVRGYIIGGPVYETEESQVTLEELRAAAVALGLDSRVGFVGFVHDAAPAMRALDIVVHASTDPEPFGLVIAEAMACGRAVVASSGGGAGEIITPGVNALAHAPGDADGLADRILVLASDPALRRRVASAAHAAAERSFGRGRLVADVTSVYEQLAARAS